MSNRAKALGSSFERKAVRLANEAGVDASKQPGSGVFKEFPNDIILNGDMLGECKVRAYHFNAKGEKCFTLEKSWIDNVCKHAKQLGMRWAVLFQPKGQQQVYAVIDYDLLLKLLSESERN
ncbi:hypothetical protein [Ktedonospora formicarum]|uniref:hypothetical protein n=1 Tax=Ktedonospora formicarum TaxID=2778364 RepID=UPI001C68E8D0|nr:hypothetical protein [Ktedonospora formicarum]